MIPGRQAAGDVDSGRLRVGVVGVGHWGRNLVRVFDRSADVRVCCNRQSKGPQEWLAENFPNIRSTHELGDVMDDPEIEAVVVATPIATHAEIVERALRAGRHVFVEKPMTDSAAAAERLHELARSLGLALFVGHVMLYDAAIEHLLRAAEKDPAESLSFGWWRYGPFREDIAWEFLPHPLSIALRLFGSEPIRSAGVRRGPQKLSADFDFGDGRGCDVTIDLNFPGKRVQGSLRLRSGAVLAWEDGRLQRLGTGGFEPVETSGEEPLAREAAAFIELVRTPAAERSDSSAALGTAVVRSIESLRLSGR